MDIFKDMPYGVEEIIISSMGQSIAISPTGVLVPMLDTAAITAIWGRMLYKIADYYDVTLTDEECVKIITACGSSVLAYLGGSKALCWTLNFVPGVSVLGCMAGNVLFNGYYTYAVGKAFHQMLEDYDINGKTVYEIAKILVHLFVPMPSVKTLKEIFSVMKNCCNV